MTQPHTKTFIHTICVTKVSLYELCMYIYLFDIPESL